MDMASKLQQLIFIIYLNTYYKGVRFYSICSKLFKFFPNITLNHFTFWNKMFEKDFINIVDRIQ